MPRALIRSVSPSMLMSSSHKAGSPSIYLKDCSQQTGSYGVLRDGAVSAAAEAPLRRACSLDAVCLLGHWPRDRTVLPTAAVAARPADKATQTPEEWAALRSRSSPQAWSSGLVSPSACAGDHREKKLIRQRLQRSSKEASARMWSLGGSVRYSPVPGDHSLLVPAPAPVPAAPIPIPCAGAGRPPTTPPRTRSSVEGLNQEIERLVQQRVLSFSQCPVDGHLAPVDELLMRARRSVNTQTPVDEQLLSPTLPDMETLTLTGGASKCSTPELEPGRLGSSPQINRFLARAPPDGCERVSLKTGETSRRPVPLDPLIKPAVFELKPSLGSAFSRPAFRKRSEDAASALPSPAKPPLQLKAAALSKS